MFTFGTDIFVARASVRGFRAGIDLGMLVLAVCVHADAGWLDGGGCCRGWACGWLAAGCYGGTAASVVRVVRRRRLVLGGSPAAARRAVSAWRVFQASRMRWLRRASRQASHSASGGRPMSRHQPRLMLLLAGALMVAEVRPEPVRRGGGGPGGAGGGAGVFAGVGAAARGAGAGLCWPP